MHGDMKSLWSLDTLAAWLNIAKRSPFPGLLFLSRNRTPDLPSLYTHGLNTTFCHANCDMKFPLAPVSKDSCREIPSSYLSLFLLLNQARQIPEEDRAYLSTFITIEHKYK